MFNMLTSSKGNFRVSLQNRHYFFSLFLSDSFGLKMIRARRAIGSRYVGEEERKEGRKGGRVAHLLRARIGEHDLWLERRMAWLFYSTLEEERSTRFLRVRQIAFIFTRPKKSNISVDLVLPAWILYIFLLFEGYTSLLASPMEKCQRRTNARRITTATLQALSPSEFLW